MTINFGPALAAGLMLCAGAAVAQDPSLPANFGAIRLTAGFDPDPHVVEVVAGGEINAYSDTPLPAECVGNISDAPDFEVTYDAGSLPLAFRVVSKSDTTLLVNDPDGEWSCDDDSFGDGDPQVVFRKPKSGTYDVWIGVFGDTADATLGITETP